MRNIKCMKMDNWIILLMLEVQFHNFFRRLKQLGMFNRNNHLLPNWECNVPRSNTLLKLRHATTAAIRYYYTIISCKHQRHF
jgi:hypothetical protein